MTHTWPTTVLPPRTPRSGVSKIENTRPHPRHTEDLYDLYDLPFRPPRFHLVIVSPASGQMSTLRFAVASSCESSFRERKVEHIPTGYRPTLENPKSGL
jgi:hypothetical protein